MEKQVQYELYKDTKMHKYLLENSVWYKNLNRNPNNYKDFVYNMRIKYRLNLPDKISDAIDNIDLISSIITNIK